MCGELCENCPYEDECAADDSSFDVAGYCARMHELAAEAAQEEYDRRMEERMHAMWERGGQ